MAEPTGQEILMWALVNRARLDPAGEAARYNINLNEGPVTDFNGNVFTITTASKQPLAWNAALFAVADQHSADMLQAGMLYHNTQATHEANLTAAGYSFSAWGENVSESLPITAQYTSTQAIYDQHQALFVDSGTTGRGHRYNIMLDTYQELGVGQVVGGPFDGASSRSLITEDFGRPSAATQFLTGIAYNDTNGDAFYSVGEGRGGISVTTSAPAGTVATGPAGYYSRAVNAVANQTVTFSGGDLAAAVSVSITILAGRNALLDLVGQSTVETSVSLTALNGVTKIIGLGNTGLALTGNGLDNTIVSALGNDAIDGAGGFDTAVYAGNRANYQITNNANGTVTVAGAEGTDTLTSIEQIQFKDQIVGFPGSVSINDVSVTEGNAGTKVMTFTVTRTGGAAAFAVNFATSDGSATTADGDYAATSGTLNFGAGVNTQTIAVTINGDTKLEPDEAFSVNLSGATNSATISDNQGTGTILTDDLPKYVNNDFNHDGTSDILWRNSNNGSVSIWDIKQDQFIGSHSLGGVGLEWEIAGTDDFNGDGTSDILWRSNSGANAIWDVKNGAFVAGHSLGGVGTEWKVAGTGDFNGDGTSDILWRSNSGTNSIWDLKNSAFAGSHSLGGVGTEWKVAGIGDFNADGTSDILWRNSNNGSNSIWDIKDGAFVAGHTLGGVGLEWKVAGIGDFNADGTSDILWRNTNSGANAIWDLKNGAFVGNHSLGGVGVEWDVAEVGDFNGDGSSDILWRNSSGANAIWDIGGGQVIATHSLGGVGTEWHIFS